MWTMWQYFATAAQDLTLEKVVFGVVALAVSIHGLLAITEWLYGQFVDWRIRMRTHSRRLAEAIDKPAPESVQKSATPPVTKAA